MPFEQGNTLSPGRTANVGWAKNEILKTKIGKITEDLLERLPELLEEMIERNPKDAVDVAIKLLEYNLPKMSRMEIKGDIEQRIQQISVNINRNNASND